MFEFNDFQSIGQIVAAFGAALIVFNLFASATGSDTSLKFAGAEINGSKSTIIFLVGIALIAYHVHSTRPNDKSVPPPNNPVQPAGQAPQNDSQTQAAPAPGSRNNDVSSADENKPDRPDGEKFAVTGWSYYGRLKSDGSWKEKNFSDGSGLDLKPQAGDILYATGIVSFREGPIQYSVLSGWTNQPRIDILKSGQSVKVTKTLVVQKSYYWIQIEME